MIRRSVTILLLISFLLLSMGTVELLHAMHGHEHEHGHGHEHKDHGSHDCQICYFLNTAATALVVFVADLSCIGNLTPSLFTLHEVPLLRQDWVNPAAPRAPPIA
ncbi:MAG: hypothetical protein MI923_17340 [Phycisphaerales bacterium]|nr:hypothetical protein [Phycisphaerales bacterium]